MLAATATMKCPWYTYKHAASCVETYVGIEMIFYKTVVEEDEVDCGLIV